MWQLVYQMHRKTSVLRGGQTVNGGYDSKMTLACLVVVLVFNLLSSASAADSDAPPAIASPDGNYSIESVDELREGKEPVHHLYLSKKGRAGRSDLYTYGRNVETLWSPNSNAFIVNDWLDKSHAESKLYYIDNLAYPISIGPRLLEGIKNTPEARNIARSGHNYTFLSKWINPRKIEVKVASYGSPEGEFTLYYAWDLKHSFRQIKQETKFRPNKSMPPSN